MPASAGLKVGELIADYYKTEGWDKLSGAKIKAVSVEDQDLEVCNLRTDGATKKLMELGILKDADIIHLPYDNTANSGMDAMAPVITANPRRDQLAALLLQRRRRPRRLACAAELRRRRQERDRRRHQRPAGG